MKTYRELMKEEGGNLSWCRPFATPSGKVKYVRHEGKILGLWIDGEELFPTPENLQRAAKAVAGEDYDCFEGYADAEIIEQYAVETDCRCCPWFGACMAMDEEVPEEEGQ